MCVPWLNNRKSAHPRSRRLRNCVSAPLEARRLIIPLCYGCAAGRCVGRAPTVVAGSTSHRTPVLLSNSPLPQRECAESDGALQRALP
eukprot:3540125-Prorocentrum_lima.AAC.1